MGGDSMMFTRDEIIECDLIVIVDHKGNHKWSSKRTITETVNMLRDIADKIEIDSLKAMAEAPDGN